MRIAIPLSCVAACCVATSNAQPRFELLGFINDDRNQTFAEAISADGTTVVGRGGTSAGPTRDAFRWTIATGMRRFNDIPNGDDMYAAYAVTGDGSVVFGEGDIFNRRPAARWSEAGGFEDIGVTSINSNIAYAASADGSIAFGSSRYPTSNEVAFRWSEAGGAVELALPDGAFETSLRGVSADGATAVGWVETDEAGAASHATRWTESRGFENLTPDLQFARAEAISADAGVVVGYGRNGGSGPLTAFRWSESDGREELRTLDAFASTFADAANADGSVIVGSGRAADGSNTALVWEGDGAGRSIADILTGHFGVDLGGWTLTNAASVSADGRVIVGTATNAEGEFQPWIATIPAPGTVGGLAIAAVAVLRGRRR